MYSKLKTNPEPNSIIWKIISIFGTKKKFVFYKIYDLQLVMYNLIFGPFIGIQHSSIK